MKNLHKKNRVFAIEMSHKSELYSHLIHIASRGNDDGIIGLKPVLCIGWLFFNESVEWEVMVRDVMECLVKRVTRYRCVPREHDGFTYWDEMPIEDMDLEYHFGNRQGGTFETPEAWKAHLDHLVEQGLDHEKPWWRYELVKKFPCGRSGVIMMIDHAFGDGASAISSVLAMCSKTSAVENPVFRKPKHKTKGHALTLWQSIRIHFTGFFRPFLDILVPGDRKTKLKMVDFPQRWDFSLTSPDQSMDIQKFKEIKNRIPGCTVNDVMLALTALSIRRYYLDIGDPIMNTKEDITATYAVNCRPPGVDILSHKWFGNYIVVAPTTYPLHDTPIATLLKFRDSAREKKNSLEFLMRKKLTDWVSHLDPVLGRRKFLEKAFEMNFRYSIMISNVVVSLSKLNIFEKELDDVQFIVTAPQGCYCGVATYANKVNLNIVTAGECEADPNKIVAYYREELDNLYNEITSMDDASLAKLNPPPSRRVEIGVAILAILAGIAMWQTRN